MLSDEAKSIRAALGQLLGKISEEDAQLVRMARNNLEALARDIKEMEDRYHPLEAK